VEKDDGLAASAQGARAAGTVLVVGANGFLAGHVIAALRRQGWQVIRAARQGDRPLAADERECDLARMISPEAWTPLLDGVDAVINLAGILRETRTQRFDVIHHDAPLALAKACVAANVPVFIQISALGEPADGGFIASKHRFDEALLALPLRAVVLRPSVVYATSGSYGGTSLLRALAAMPGGPWLPGHGQWRIQPIAVEDLGELIARTLGSDASDLFEVGGPAPITLETYQQQWRRWLRLPTGKTRHVPEWLASLTVAISEWTGRGPLGATMWRMLRRGNVTATDAGARLQAAFGVRPQALDAVLARQSSQVQDRWQAQLYFLVPALKWMVVALWLISAWAGWTTPASAIEAMAVGTPLASWQPVLLARVGGAFDAALGLWLLSGWRPRTAVMAMILLVCVYTASLGIGLPRAWLDPLGGLAKNLVLLPALGMLWVLTDRR